MSIKGRETGSRFFRKKETDIRIKKKRRPWLASLLTFSVMIVLSGGQAMILAEYMSFSGRVPLEFIFGFVGYWAIAASIFSLIVYRQVTKGFDDPMQRLSKAAKDVAGGDFSIFLQPVHTPDKYDYMDVTFEDFNKMVEELGSIETLKNDFIANVSHEIKTPLSIIQNSAMLIKDARLTPDRRDEYAETIISATARLNSLVSNILKLNKLENTEIQPSADDYDLCRQLSDCALAFEDLWEKKKIVFDVDMEDRVVIRADMEMMEIVWHNLFSNALKFTQPGGTVALRQTSGDEAVTVTISDTGCGMSEETLEHIFDKFYQGDTSHATEGNGLGLALSLRVLQLEGGTITAKSRLGEGSEFTVRLPAAAKTTGDKNKAH